MVVRHSGESYHIYTLHSVDPSMRFDSWCAVEFSRRHGEPIDFVDQENRDVEVEVKATASEYHRYHREEIDEGQGETCELWRKSSNL